jgi:hypothetical protein
MENPTSGQSINSIRIARKVKANGTIVRIKETFFSDGTSYTEEKVVFRPSTSAPNPPTRASKSRCYDKGTRLVEYHKKDQPISDHSLQYLPTSIDKPAPVTILPHYRLPQSKSSRVYLILRKFIFLLVLLSLSALVAAWILVQDRSIDWYISLFRP